MPSDRVTITQKSNGDWVVRYGNRSYNHGRGATGRAHATRQVKQIHASKQKGKSARTGAAGPRRRR